MRLAKGTDYAYRILMLVAMNDDQTFTVESVAEALHLSRTHSMKLIAKLSTLGFLQTKRGRGGGLMLGMPAAEIRMGDVAKKMEPDFGLVECLCKPKEGQVNYCLMHGGCEMSRLIAKGISLFIDHLNEHSLQDILDVSKNSSKLKWPACMSEETSQKDAGEETFPEE